MNHQTKAVQELIDHAVGLTDGHSQGAVIGEALAYLTTAAAAVARDGKFERSAFLQVAREAHDHINKRKTQ